MFPPEKLFDSLEDQKRKKKKFRQKDGGVKGGEDITEMQGKEADAKKSDTKEEKGGGKASVRKPSLSYAAILTVRDRRRSAFGLGARTTPRTC